VIAARRGSVVAGQGFGDIFSPQQVNDPWPPLPSTVGAAETVTSQPHLEHVYFSPCFICMGNLLSGR
jgi:hypothetical protein